MPVRRGKPHGGQLAPSLYGGGRHGRVNPVAESFISCYTGDNLKLIAKPLDSGGKTEALRQRQYPKSKSIIRHSLVGCGWVRSFLVWNAGGWPKSPHLHVKVLTDTYRKLRCDPRTEKKRFSARFSL
jgi:hypothetical protein